MLRSVTLSVALSVLAAACMTVAPPTSEAWLIRMQVFAERPVELTVVTPNGVLPGAVLPALPPKGSTTDVAFFFPVDDSEWWIAANGSNVVERAELERSIRQGCDQLVMRFTADGSSEFGCDESP